MAAADLFFFVGASLLLIVAPGPDIVFLISQALARGRRAGLVTALGLSAGNLLHTCAAALGLSIIFRTSVTAFQGLKILGVCYLLFLAYKAIQNRRQELHSSDTSATLTGSLFWRAFLMNVLNPKVALFFLAFLPQFAIPESGPVWIQLLLLGALFTVLVVVVFTPIGLFAGYFNRWICRPGVTPQGYFGWFIALVYFALAVKLALVTR